MADVFAAQIFFVVFRECLEATVIISVLLAFLKQSLGQPGQDKKLYKRLVWQVWMGTAVGIFVCLCIGGAFIGVFYGLGRDIWSESEDLWEGIFYIIACIIVTIMGFALLRINKMKEKWRLKIAQSLLEQPGKKWGRNCMSVFSRKYVMFFLPFITAMREGVEAVVYVGGVSLGLSAKSIPLPVVCGLLAGLAVGLIIYRGGNRFSLHIFMIASTCFLYLIAAGMFSKALWYLQFYKFSQKVGGDVAEAGSGPGSYNIKQSVWHVNCCNPETSGGYEVFNALLGWQNSATYASVISYCCYWILVICMSFGLLYVERKGHWPFQREVLGAMSKLPLIGGKYQKKLDLMDEKTDKNALVRRAEAILGGGIAEESNGTGEGSSITEKKVTQ